MTYAAGTAIATAMREALPAAMRLLRAERSSGWVSKAVR
jgi:hypothetical protein